jgi:hypothetical protein
MVYEKRYNEIIDRMIADERRETLAFQRVVFPTVALYVSAVLSTSLKPQIFAASGNIGKIVIVTLFIIGVLHLAGRVRDGLLRYTESGDDIHESILDNEEKTSKPHSRLIAAATLIGGLFLCLGLGLLIGTQIDFAYRVVPTIFAPVLQAEFFLYPPIVTLFVDMMHTVASKLEG